MESTFTAFLNPNPLQQSSCADSSDAAVGAAARGASVELLLEAIRGYYFDDSPDSPGHWLLGPLDS